MFLRNSSVGPWNPAERCSPVILKMARSLGHHDSTDTTQKKAKLKSVGRFSARSHWGGVYNREMKQLMLQHAFKFVTSVIFVVGSQNWRSQKAVLKIGGTLVGSKPDKDGRLCLVYQITESTFLDSFAHPGVALHRLGATQE